MKTVKALAFFGSVLFLVGTAAIAQDFTKANHKILGHQTQSYQQHAQDKAQTLYYYSQARQPVPKTEAKDLLEGMQKDLKKSDAALAKLQTEFAKNKDAIELIDSIKKHQTKATEHCGMAEEACMKDEPEGALVGDCCADMYHELEAAKVDTQKLLKMLKIDNLEPPKKVATKKK